MSKKNDSRFKSSPVTAPWYNHKHFKSQVNGETEQGLNLIILERETRKRS